MRGADATVPAERDRTEPRRPGGPTVHELFEEQAARRPDAPAVRCDGDALTYRELERAANRVANRLRSLGVGAEDVVGVCLDRSVGQVVAVLGVLKAGGAYLPLDPTHPEERTRALVQDAGARALVAADAMAERLRWFTGRVVWLGPDGTGVEGESDRRPVAAAGSHGLAYVIYTSGTTGTPKGVEVEHRQVTGYVRGVGDRLGMGEGERYAMVQPLSVDSSVTMLFGSLLRGGCLHVVDRERSLDGERMRAFVLEQAIDHLKIAPSHLRALRGELGGILPRNRLVIGGEGSSATWASDLAREGPCAVFNHYGPTETTVGVLVHEVERGVDDGAGTTPLGRPLPECRMHVLDDRMLPVGPGAAGELYVGGGCVARGYRGRPAATAAAFVPDPFAPAGGGRLYRTGDVVRLRADGVLEFLGRRDDQVKLRGHRVELGEVQAVLETHPGVRECAVLVRESAGDATLVAYVALGDECADDELHAHVAARLPEFMLPARYVRVQGLPRTRHGKVDRAALSELTVARPEPRGGGSREPETDDERVLVEIWRELLGVDDVGVEDDFFALGGHSLLAARLVSRVRETLGVAVRLHELFEAPTVAGLARRLQAARSPAGAARMPQLERVERGGLLPSSYGQRRLWLLQELDPADGSYNTWLSWRLRGELDAGALERALKGLARDHEVLRTRFVTEGGEPKQEVLDGWEPALAAERTDGEERARRELEAEVARPFALEAGPALRARLLETGPDAHLLLLVLHHAVTDGWSMRLLEDELWERYEWEARGEAMKLAEGGVEYADYAIWQRRWLEDGGEGERQLGYWKERLRGAPMVLELATDRPRAAARRWEGGRRWFKLGRGLTERLRALSRREGVTLYMTLLAAFQIVLWRYSGQREPLVGSPVSGRGQPELEGVLGFFVNTLVMRGDLRGNPSFRELLGRVRADVLGGLSNQDLPFERLVEELGVERDVARTPLFQVMFAFQGGEADRGRGLRVSGLDVTWFGVGSEREKFDLSLSVQEGEAELYGSLAYSTDLFEPTTARRMLRRYRGLLEEVATAPGRRIVDLGLPPERERAALLAAGSGTAGDMSIERAARSVELEVADRARERPEAVALVSRGTALTYGELDDRAGRVARALRTRGVRPESRVGLLSARGVELVVGLLGILRAGAAFVPLDPDLPGERLEHMARDAGVEQVVVGQRRLRGLLGGHRGEVVLEDLDDAGAPDERPEPDADGLAYVMYTSGSTGRPKGVAVTRRGLASYVSWASRTYGVAAGDGGGEAPGPGQRPRRAGSIVHTSAGFDLTLTSLLVPLVRGERVELADEADGLEELAEALRSDRVYGLVKLTPAHLEALARLVETGELRARVGALVVGGDRLWWTAVDGWLASGAAVFNEYGPTEAVVGCVVHRLGEGGNGPVPIGRPAPNVRARVLTEDMQPVGVGMVGELSIGGPQVARGYWGKPAETAERFVPDPWGGPGDRLYRTGDLARWTPGGELEYVGRRDRQVKVRGHRVEPGEVEAVMREHEGVRDAVVAPRGGALVGYVAWRERDRTAELRSWLTGKLPRHMVPAIVGLAELPLTSNGKVDLQALTRLPVEAGRRGAAEPGTEEERALIAIWKEVLGVDEVGVEDDFFDLGGHSLLVIQMFARVREELGIDLPPRVIFEAPVIAELAQAVVAARRGDAA